MAEAQRDNSDARSESDRAFLKKLSGQLPSWQMQLRFWSLAVMGFAADLYTKWLVFKIVYRDGTIRVIGDFVRFVVAENTGAAFGIAAGYRAILITVSAAAFIVVVGIFLFGGAAQRLVVIALGLFAAGVCGNLYDRVFNEGRVRDFVDVVYWPGRHWPAFNVADSLLCISVGLLILLCVFHHKQQAS